MGRILITGSSDGLGLMAGQLLSAQGHAVVLHARSEARAENARAALPQAEAVLVGDVSTRAAMRDVAEQANTSGRSDAVIHVGLGYREPRRIKTVNGPSQLWAVNVLAPYVLTALMNRPSRLVYLSSGMHRGGDPTLDDRQWSQRRWNGSQACSDTKLHDVLLAFGVARACPAVPSNVSQPWVEVDVDGWPGRSRRPQPGPSHAGVAVRRRPPRRGRDCGLLLPPAACRRASRRARHRTAGPTVRRLP